MIASDWIQLTGIFLALGGAAFFLVILAVRKSSPKSVAELEEDDFASATDTRPMFLGSYTTAFAHLLPGAKNTTGELVNDLRTAGFYRPTAALEYRAIRNILLLISLLVAGGVALLVPEDYLISTLIGGGLAVLSVFSVPRVYISLRGRARLRAMERGLPLAMDMLVLCLTAGQHLLGAVLQVARQLRRLNPVLAQELTITYQQAQLHSLGLALHQWSDRVKIADVRNLVLVLVQSEKLGADAVSALSELSVSNRTTARQKAEEHANRTSFWMLFPSVFCFWVAAGLILVGPAYLEYFAYQRRSSEMIREATKGIREFNQDALGQPQP